MEQKRQFFIVWRVGGGTPTHQHDSFESAAAEAERLCRMHRGREFVVLESLRGYKIDDLQVVHYTDDIPF